MDNVITEQQIIDVLASKHTRDLFVPHCKTGPSWGGGKPMIFDAWVMPYSWTKPIIGYEIKTDHSDFKWDRKWPGYLEFCNLFYFVCPWGLIDLKEVPKEAGLCYLTKTGASVRYIKRSPVHWWHMIPPSIFQYVLMWRKQELKSIEKTEER